MPWSTQGNAPRVVITLPAVTRLCPQALVLKLPCPIHPPFALPVRVLILGSKDLNKAQRVKLCPALHGENVGEANSHSDPWESTFSQPAGSKIFDP